MKYVGELDFNEELDEQMRAVLMWMNKTEKCKSAPGPISLSACGKSFISYVSVTYILYCLVLSCLSCFLYIYKHNYGAIVLGREGCHEVLGLQILFWTKVYIFSDSLLSDIIKPLNIPFKFLDITTLQDTQAANSNPCPGHDDCDKIVGNSQPHGIGKQIKAAW